MDRLFAYLSKPKPYEPSTHPFWDDEHISKGMLEAHLNPDRDAATRKHSFVKQSVEWLCKMFPSQKYPKVLDLGCGPGIYADLLNQKGYSVTGIDISERSIAYAKAQNPNNIYFCMNYLNCDFPAEFDLILLIYCDFSVLREDERQKLLRIVFKALKKGGYFVFDVNTLKFYQNRPEEQKNWYLNEGSGFWRDKTYLVLESFNIYEPDVFLKQYVVLEEDLSFRVYRIWDKAYTEKSLMEELKTVSYSECRIFEDVCGKKFNEDSRTMCVVLNK